MKAFKLAILLLIVSFPLNFNNELKTSSSSGVSNYSINQSITYQVDINYTLTHTRNTSQFYCFKVARFNDRQPNSPLTQFCPSYQEAQLLYNSITGYDTLIMGLHDKFNNTYDLFNATLDTSETITLSQKYTIKLNEVVFGNIVDTDIGSYDTSDEMFNLYCNNTETYYEINDIGLINASNSIVDLSDNPLEKAQKISSWIDNNIVYDEFTTLPAGEKGAKWAYDNKFGDCSEFSSLMITLLRIQGIPARKVTGYFIGNETEFNPAVGEIITLTLDSSGSSSLPGHAWVEYYIPEIGWIACEPQDSYSYKKIDYRRFNLNIGAWFFIPGATIPYESEFPHYPAPVVLDHNAYTFDYKFKITVLETDLILTKIIVIIVIVSIVGIVILVVTLLVKSNRKKRKQYKQFSNY